MIRTKEQYDKELEYCRRFKELEEEKEKWLDEWFIRRLALSEEYEAWYDTLFYIEEK